MNDDKPLSTTLQRVLKGAKEAVEQGRRRYDSLAAAVSSRNGTQIKLSFNCNPKMPDKGALQPEAVRKGVTAQDGCVQNVQHMIDLLRANVPPQHEAWSAALASRRQTTSP